MMKYLTLHVGDTSYSNIPFFVKDTPEKDIPYTRNFVSTIISPTGENMGKIFSIPDSFTWDDDTTNTGVYYDSPEGRRLLVNTDKFYTIATLVRGASKVLCNSSTTTLRDAGIYNKLFPRSLSMINDDVGFYALVKANVLSNDDKHLNVYEGSIVTYGYLNSDFSQKLLILQVKGKIISI